MEEDAMTGPLGTEAVYDFSGDIQEAPKVSNLNVLTQNIREAGEKLDDTDEFAAQAGQYLRQFNRETQEQMDFIETDQDFSLNQISGFQGETARLRSRQAQGLQDVYATAAGLVQSREQKRLIKEEREYQEKLLKEQTKLDLSLKAASLGIKGASSMSRNELIDSIAGKVANSKVSSGGGAGGGTGTGSTNLFQEMLDAAKLNQPGKQVIQSGDITNEQRSVENLFDYYEEQQYL